MNSPIMGWLVSNKNACIEALIPSIENQTLFEVEIVSETIHLLKVRFSLWGTVDQYDPIWLRSYYEKGNLMHTYTKGEPMYTRRQNQGEDCKNQKMLAIGHWKLEAWNSGSFISHKRKLIFWHLDYRLPAPRMERQWMSGI